MMYEGLYGILAVEINSAAADNEVITVTVSKV
jgi:hypothetical protein